MAAGCAALLLLQGGLCQRVLMLQWPILVAAAAALGGRLWAMLRLPLQAAV
jgi:hypothetical protein